MTESLLTLISVVALLLGSPGPAPLALAGVGASFGVMRGLAFLFGILSALVVVIICAALGLSALLSVYPAAKLLVQIIGGLYILYVAYKIAVAPVVGDAASQERPPSFIDGFILNLLNPKAYAVFFAIFSQFTLPLESDSLALFVTGLVCIVIATVVDGAWLMLGGVLRPIFKAPLQARVLRISFSMLMVVAVAWTMLG